MALLNGASLNDPVSQLAQTFAKELVDANNILPETMKSSKEAMAINKYLGTVSRGLEELIGDFAEISPDQDPIMLFNKVITSVRMMVIPGVTAASGPSTNVLINSTINILVKNTPKPIQKHKEPRAKKTSTKTKTKTQVDKPEIRSTSSVDFSDVFSSVPKENPSGVQIESTSGVQPKSNVQKELASGVPKENSCGGVQEKAVTTSIPEPEPSAQPQTYLAPEQESNYFRVDQIDECLEDEILDL